MSVSVPVFITLPFSFPCSKALPSSFSFTDAHTPSSLPPSHLCTCSLPPSLHFIAVLSPYSESRFPLSYLLPFISILTSLSQRSFKVWRFQVAGLLEMTISLPLLLPSILLPTSIHMEMTSSLAPFYSLSHFFLSLSFIRYYCARVSPLGHLQASERLLDGNNKHY